MPLTRDFRVTIQERLERDPGFREALLEEGVQCLLAGEVDVGKSVLRDYVKATIGFRGTQRANREIAQKPYPHAQPEQQSTSTQPLPDHQVPSGTRRAAPQSTGRSVTGKARRQADEMPCSVPKCPLGRDDRR